MKINANTKKLLTAAQTGPVEAPDLEAIGWINAEGRITESGQAALDLALEQRVPTVDKDGYEALKAIAGGHVWLRRGMLIRSVPYRVDQERHTTNAVIKKLKADNLITQVIQDVEATPRGIEAFNRYAMKHSELGFSDLRQRHEDEVAEIKAMEAADAVTTKENWEHNRTVGGLVLASHTVYVGAEEVATVHYNTSWTGQPTSESVQLKGANSRVYISADDWALLARAVPTIDQLIREGAARRLGQDKEASNG